MGQLAGGRNQGLLDCHGRVAARQDACVCC